jgi:dolichyl-diphosphooligosaccharide--protein glycosyltransferase
VVFLPSISSAKALAGSPNYVMDEGWYTSLLWLRDNSPDPFGDPNFYYELYKTPFYYPESAYGVMSWWDYGYFIMQIAHRIPNANPGQGGAKEAGQFFTAQNESSANELADRLGMKYVMIDYAMATPMKFYAMAEWADSNSSEFYEIYYVPTSTSGGQWRYLFYPAYYNSTVVRLYNFDGKAVTPTQSIVISYEETEYQGQKYKQVTGGQYFPSYGDAQAYVANQTSGNYKIVGDNPFSSIVPLEKLNSYKLVYPPGATTNITATTVKIFEYLGSNQS